MRKLTSTEASYLAGLLDGEGSFSICRCKCKLLDGHSRFNFQCRIEIGMSHRPTIEFISKIFDSKIRVYIPRNGRWNRKNMYYALLSSSKELKEFLPQVLPYLITKSKQCKLLLEFVNFPKPKWPQRTGIEAKAELYRKVRNLNTKISEEDFEKVKRMLLRRISQKKV
jgi:hypothetical protein